jgi:hypothetical protein
MFAVAALIASAGVCAAQDRSQNESRWAQLLLDSSLAQFGPDSHVVAFGRTVIVTSAESFVQDGRSVPIRQLICEGTSLVVRDPQLAMQDLYPAPEGFCDTLLQALRRRAGQRP